MAKRLRKDSEIKSAQHKEAKATGAGADEGRAQRIPLSQGETHPYTWEQYQYFKTVFCDVAQPDSFEHYWPRIRDAADRCATNLVRQNRRKADPNVWRRINRAIERGDISGLIERHPDEIDALLYGAMESKLIAASPGTGYEAEIACLQELSKAELKIALETAKAKNSILYKSEGRPGGGPIEQFARVVGAIYEEATGRRLGTSYDSVRVMRTGPAVRFLQAAIDPVLPYFNLSKKNSSTKKNLSTHGIRDLIDRIKDDRRPC